MSGKPAFKQGAEAVRREIEQLPNPLPPVKNSLDFNIEDLEKPTALYLFREDFAADNKVAFNGKFKGKWTVKVNSVLGVGGTLNAPKLEVIDDAQLNGPIGHHNIQLKFKPTKFSAQLDLGHHLSLHKAHVHNNVKDHFHLFSNPYLFYETDRVFKKQLLGLGLILNTSNGIKDNTRLNFRWQEGKFDWDITSNTLFKSRGFFFNWFLNMNIRDALNFSDRRFLLGYDRDGINANLEFNFAKGSFRDWKLSQTTLSGSYDFREPGVLALLLSKNYAAIGATGDAQVADAGKEKALEHDIAVGYRNKLNNNTELKTKFAYSGLASAFVNHRIQEGLNLHLTVQTNITNKNNKGFLEYPFDLGLKLKFEH